MIERITVGVTGGIGSGKSMVCRILETLGVPVYYADDRGKALLVESEEVIKKVIDLFGNESYIDGNLNRSYLAEKVFSDSAELKKLNAVVHPAVAKDFKRFLDDNEGHSIVAKEAALLFETGSYQSLDKNIAVMAKKHIRVKRVLLRDVQRSSEQIEQIMAKQTSDGQRKKLADWLIDNNGEQLLIPQVMAIYYQLLKLTGN